MKTITYTIEITFDDEGDPSLVIAEERYVQIHKGYWAGPNGQPMCPALSELAETWITRNGKDAS
jgi:hypothetical protein